jgi:Ca-activated chloride channel homolog
MKNRPLVFALLIMGFLLASLKSESTGAQEIKRSQQRPLTVPTARSSQKDTPPDTKEDLDPEVVRVDTELVNTIFTAIDRDHRFVTTLRAEDLRILEDEMEQEISIFERKTERPLSLVMLIDTSKSQEKTLHDEKLAAKGFISSVMRPAKDKFAVVSFTGKPTFVEPLTGNITRLQRGVERLKVEFPADNCVEEKPVQEDPLCWTSIWDSVWAGTNEILAKTSDDSRRAIILVTDGDDTSSTIKRQEAIESAVKNNVVVYSIGIGDPESYKLERDTLVKVSDRTGGRAFFPRDNSELQAAFAQVQDELRSQYLLAYSPKNKARNGSYRKVKIDVVNLELRKRGLKLLYRQGYYGRKG